MDTKIASISWQLLITLLWILGYVYLFELVCVFSKYIPRSGIAGSCGCFTVLFSAFWTEIWHYYFLSISYYNKDKMVYRILKSIFRDYIYSIILRCKWSFEVLLQLANLIMDCLKLYIFTYLKKKKKKKNLYPYQKIKKKEPLRRCATSKFTLCPYLQPTVSSHSFLNSGKIICTLIHMNPLGCLLTSQKLLSTTLCRYLVNDLVQLPKE